MVDNVDQCFPKPEHGVLKWLLLAAPQRLLLPSKRSNETQAGTRIILKAIIHKNITLDYQNSCLLLYNYNCFSSNDEEKWVEENRVSNLQRRAYGLQVNALHINWMYGLRTLHLMHCTHFKWINKVTACTLTQKMLSKSRHTPIHTHTHRSKAVHTLQKKNSYFNFDYSKNQPRQASCKVLKRHLDGEYCKSQSGGSFTGHSWEITPRERESCIVQQLALFNTACAIQ